MRNLRKNRVAALRRQVTLPSSCNLKWHRPARNHYETGRNVRRASSGALRAESWVPAPEPGSVRPDDWLPLGCVVLEDVGREVLLMRSGQLLGVIVGEPGYVSLSEVVTEVGQLSGDVLQGEWVAPGMLRIDRCHRPAVYVTYTAADEGLCFSMLGELPELPQASVVVADVTAITEAKADSHLSGLSGAGAVGIIPADRRVVTKNMVACYQRLRSQAEKRGLYHQPTLARWRVLTPAGETLVCGPTVMLSASGGFQCRQQVSMSTPDNLKTLTGGSLTAMAYGAEVAIAGSLAAPWRRLAVELVVETLEPIEPFNLLDTCDVTVQASSGAGESSSGIVAKATMPGLASTAELQLLQGRELIKRALATADEGWRVQAVIRDPFDPEAGSRRRVALRQTSPLSKVGRVMLPELRGVMAGCVCRADMYRLYGNLMLQWRGSHVPMAHAADLAGASQHDWMAVASVRDSSGRCGVATSYGEASALTGTMMPEKFSPLLVVANPEARELWLQVQSSDGTVRSRRFALTPMPEAGVAYYLAEDLQELELPSTSQELELPLSTVEAKVMPGAVAVTLRGSRNHPVQLYASSRGVKEGNGDLMQGALRHLCPAPRTNGTWDFSRMRVIAAGQEGTRLLTFDQSGVLKASALLDRRPIGGPGSLAEATGPQGWQLVALAGGDLVKITQSGVTTLMRQAPGLTVGWCRRYGEGWLTDDRGRTMRVCFPAKGEPELVEACYPRTIIRNSTAEVIPWSNARLLSWEGDLLVQCAGRLLNTSLDADAVKPELSVRPMAQQPLLPIEPFDNRPKVDCSLSLRHYLVPAASDARSSRVCRVKIDLTGGSVDGNVMLYADRGRFPGYLLCNELCSGSLNSPHEIAVAAAAGEFLTLKLEAKVSEDTLLGPVEVAFGE